MSQKASSKKYFIILPVFILLIGFLAYSAFSESSVYYLEVNQLVSLNQNDINNEPQKVRVFGSVGKDELLISSLHDQVEFTLQDKDDPSKQMRVNYKGAVPEALTVGSHVIIEGVYLKGHGINASKLMTQCPSKYKRQDT